MKATFPNGPPSGAYTYAGELPNRAYGFGNHGLAFTLNSAPPSENGIVAGGSRRNLSRDLLEATSLDNALTVHDENSLSRQKRAALLRKQTEHGFLSLGDTNDSPNPIYMTGLCTALINLDEQILLIIPGNPKGGQATRTFAMPLEEFRMPQ